MILLIVFLFVTVLWQNAHAEYGAPCEIQNNFMGKCVPTLSCKHIGNADSCGTFDNVQYVCCANDQIQYNPKSMEQLKNLKCGKYTPGKIYNGNKVKAWTRPWMAVLKYKTSDIKPNAFRCGGTLISKRHVLTAAHCVKGLENELEKVRLGEHDLSKKTDCVQYTRFKRDCFEAIDFDIDNKFIHEDYKSNNTPLYDDIALLRLRESVEFNKYISPICLPITPKLRNMSETKTKFHITGWGVTENGNLSNVLMWAEVNKVDLDNCRELYHIEWQDSQICARGNDTDSCTGDSGGPLQAPGYYYDFPGRIVQFGVVSEGPNCQQNQYELPSIYTNVLYYIQWITDKMQM